MQVEIVDLKEFINEHLIIVEESYHEGEISMEAFTTASQHLNAVLEYVGVHFG